MFGYRLLLHLITEQGFCFLSVCTTNSPLGQQVVNAVTGLYHARKEGPAQLSHHDSGSYELGPRWLGWYILCLKTDEVRSV